MFSKLVSVAHGDDTPSFLMRQLESAGYRRLDEPHSSSKFLDPKDNRRVIVVASDLDDLGPYDEYWRFVQWAKTQTFSSIPKIYGIHEYQCQGGEPHFIVEMEHFALDIQSDDVVWNDDNMASLCCLWDDTIGATWEVFPDKLANMLFHHYGKILGLNPVVEPFDADTDEAVDAAFAERNAIEAHIVEVSKACNNDFAKVLREIMKGDIVDYAFHKFTFDLSSIAVRPDTFELVLVSTR